MGKGDVQIVIGAVVERADGKPKPGPSVAFAWSPQLESDNEGRVRNRNLARTLLNMICDNEDTLIEGWPDEKDYVHLWHVTLRITTLRNGPRVDVEYERLPPCDAGSADDMMELFLMVKSTLRRTGGARPRGRKSK